MSDQLGANLTLDQHEALQEIVNIGMGLAGNSLARILNTFVELSIPRIRLVKAEDLPSVIVNLVSERTEVSAIRQAFFNHWRGEAVAIYDQHGCKDLADLMGYTNEMDHSTETELLLDVGNVLVGACLNGVSEQLNAEISFGAPSILAQHVHIEELFAKQDFNWSHTLLLEVNFALENRQFKSHLLTMMSEESISTLQLDIDNFLETL